MSNTFFLFIKNRNQEKAKRMSAIFDFSSLLTVFLLLVCTATYIRELRPTIFDGTVLNHNGNGPTTPDGQNTMGGDAVSTIVSKIITFLSVM